MDLLPNLVWGVVMALAYKFPAKCRPGDTVVCLNSVHGCFDERLFDLAVYVGNVDVGKSDAHTWYPIALVGEHLFFERLFPARHHKGGPL